MIRPSGTVTFLLTDIEGSTRRWETDAESMRSALTAHDEVLRSAIEAHGGWLFKHTGDGVCAAFGSARAAIDAATDAQRRLGLPVRMGIATGEAQERDGDYFGPALNRAARVMAVGHGGQILVAATTAALVDGADLLDLGERRLRDLSGAHRLFQVRGDGLAEVFPELRTLDAVPGNLPVQSANLVGRELAVKDLAALIPAHRLVTLTGVGGVGKTRLAVQVAAELAGDFPDGVWLVELAPIGDPAAVPSAVATVLGVTAQAGSTITESIANVLSGRRLLIVLDNCEHVLDAAAALVETILARAATLTVVATSREGLRVAAEWLWPVPSLNVGANAGAAAVELFVERARAVNPGFEVLEDAEMEAVTEICRRLDGNALAIELAAARMMSMSPQDVRDRLDDRFRLLAGPRRGLERHQTLRQMVQWSYDLLDDNEKAVLSRCSVFSDGFDVNAATHVCDGLDEYAVLDVLDSLVRKSLVSAERLGGHARYGMLETIRQFAVDQLTAATNADEVRDRHARHFADQATANWDVWDSPRQHVALAWFSAEFANLRTAFRWASDRDEIATATAIAAHTAVVGYCLQRLEAVGWAEELLPAATTGDVRQLPRLYSAAGLCVFTGHLEAATRYAQTAVALETDTRYDPFPTGWSSLWELAALLYSGQIERYLEIAATMTTHDGFRHGVGLAATLYLLPAIGRSVEAMAIAEDALTATRKHGNPFWIAFALQGYGRAFAETDPQRALAVFRQGLLYTEELQIPDRHDSIARDAAPVEALHGDLQRGLSLFDSTINSLHRTGNIANLATILAHLTVVFERIGQPDVAATIYGSSTSAGINTTIVVDLTAVVDRLRAKLGDTVFHERVATGAAMGPAEAVLYARQQIQLVAQNSKQTNHSHTAPRNTPSRKAPRPAR
ncbi:MAG: ATP-binding protein [Acidimicrobiales bacterium]